MRARSTIICTRGDWVLLVARTQSRWALPDGTIRRHETPLDAAHRELSEETTLTGTELTYLFQFRGLDKRHYVFLTEPAVERSPEADGEIAECRWFSLYEVSMLSASIPTQEIVNLFRQFGTRVSC